MRVNASGQITIPADLREKLWLYPQTEVVIEVTNEGILIRKKTDPQNIDQWIRKMTGQGDVNMTTDQVMNMTRGED